jgi:hypothetical protein
MKPAMTATASWTSTNPAARCTRVAQYAGEELRRQLGGAGIEPVVGYGCAAREAGAESVVQRQPGAPSESFHQ